MTTLASSGASEGISGPSAVVSTAPASGASVGTIPPTIGPWRAISNTGLTFYLSCNAQEQGKTTFQLFSRLEEGKTYQESPAMARAQKVNKIQNLLHLADVARSVREFCLPEKSDNPHTKIPVQDALPTLPLPDTLYTTKWRHRIRQGGASCRASLSLVIGASRVKRQVNGVKELANDGAMKCCNTTTAT